MFTFIITVDDFVYFLVKIKKQVFRESGTLSATLNLSANIQMSYIPVVQGRLFLLFNIIKL